MFSQAHKHPKQTRSRLAIGLSGAAHAAVCLLAVSSAQVDLSKTPRAPVRNLTFVNVVPGALPPAEPLVLPELLKVEKPLVVETPEVSSIDIALPEPVLHELKADTTAAFKTPTVRLPDTTDRFVAPKPVVGGFETAVEQPPAQQTAKHVQTAAFDTATARAPDVKLKPASVGTFDQSSSTQPQPGSDRPTATVAEAGFGAPNGAARPSREPKSAVIGSTGFESKTDSGTIKRSTEPRQVQAATFDAVSQPTQTSKPAPPQARASVPVEIVFKPTPTYTPEARSLRVEGDVSLEVEFCASGQVRILRVVRGLGHGLDEAAARAAERIQFKPARSGSTPIDYRAIVHITFRLT